jgi:CheY-like chemotaxis protein
MMPKINGFDVLDILRNTPETTNVRVIMLTALSQPKDKERAEQLGADDYLVKSQVGIEDVVRTVHEVLGDAPVSSASHTSAPAPIPAPPAAEITAPLR